MSTIGLTLLKLGAAAYSHSVGVFSEGIHSFLDLVSAAISFFTVQQAAKPADEGHPFGHGKFETLSSLFEALLLAAAAAFILFEAVERFDHPARLENEGIAMAVMLFSMVVSYLTYRHNKKAAIESESSALHVNALHFLADVLTGAGVFLGLIIMKLTQWMIVDILIAFSIAFYILFISLKQVKNALFELVDSQLPENEIKTILDLINRFQGGSMIEAHDLRTRKSGATRHLDFHLVVCGQMTVENSHALCDKMEENIVQTFPTASIQIHVEPCEKEKTHCHVHCPLHDKKIGQKNG